MLLVDWDSVTILQNSEVACNRVLEIFSGLYDIAFPKQNIKIRDNTVKRSWNEKAFKGVPKEKNIILNGGAKRNKINAERYT